MPAQASQKELPLVDYAALRNVLAARRAAAKPTLYVISVHETIPEPAIGGAEHDRQASLDLLHRLVMGADRTE